MAGKFTGLQKSYKMTDATGVAMYKAVVMDGAGKCKIPDADNMTPLGVVDNDERISTSTMSAGGDQTGRGITVSLGGIVECTASGAISAGDRVYLKTGGDILTLPAGDDAYYEVLGFAEKDAVDGDVIPVRFAYHSFFNKA